MSKTDSKAGKKRKLRWILAVAALLVALVAGGVVLMGYLALDETVDQMDYQETKDVAWDILPEVDDQLEGYRNIVILGVDARSMSNYDGSRSDAILILSLNKETGSINMISLMRDTYLQIYDGDGERDLDKITNAHAFGGGVGTCRALNRNLDLNIREYAIFNWKAVADVVDAFGGVRVEVKSNEIYDLNKYGNETGRYIGRPYTPVYEAGEQTLDGVQAASYCRIRKTSGGDGQRAERMKKVLEAIFAEAKGMDLAALKEISQNALPEIRTNMGTQAIFSLLTGLPGYSLDQNIALPYEYDGGMFHGGWYAVPNTLRTNVSRLHDEAFGQGGYLPSTDVIGLSWLISLDTGVGLPE